MNTKMLALAALAVLSLGAGSAMAQSSQSSGHWTQRQGTAGPQTAGTTMTRDSSQIQSGSSEVFDSNTMAPAGGGDGGGGK